MTTPHLLSKTLKANRQATTTQAGSLAAGVEYLLWGGGFFVLRVLVLRFSGSGPFATDEANFSEGALRMAGNWLSSGDYMHGPIIYYLLLGAQGLAGLAMLVSGDIRDIDNLILWYAKQPEHLWQVGRVLMSFGGAAVLVATMFTAHLLSRSRSQARVAGLVLLSMPLFHHASWYVKEDLWAALFGIVAVALAYRRNSLVAVGLSWGVAIAAKYTAVALGPALLVIVAGEGTPRLSDWRRWFSLSARLVAAAVVAFIIVNPYALIHLGTFLGQLQLINSQYLKGSTLGSISSPPILAGLVFREFLPFHVGALTLLLVGGVLALGRGNILREYPSLFLGPTAVIVLLAISRGGFVRTLVLALPWLAVLASMMCSYLTLRSRVWAAVVIVLLGALGTLQVAGLYRYLTATDTRHLARAYVERVVPANTVILLEGVHDRYIDDCPPLRPNMAALEAEQQELLGRGAAGKLNRFRQKIAAAEPDGRFEIVGVADFGESGAEQLDRAAVVIMCKWSGLYPGAQSHDIHEDIRNQTVAAYVRGRRAFQDLLEKRGFQLLTKVTPTRTARWSFLNRPDPGVFGLKTWLQGGQAIVGPEIAIYSRGIKATQLAYNRRRVRAHLGRHKNLLRRRRRCFEAGLIAENGLDCWVPAEYEDTDRCGRDQSEIEGSQEQLHCHRAGKDAFSCGECGQGKGLCSGVQPEADSATHGKREPCVDWQLLGVAPSPGLVTSSAPCWP